MDYGTLAIIGGIASLGVAFLKSKFGTNSYGTLGIVALVSLIIGAIYQVFNAAPWWEGFVQTLVWAGAIYTYILERFKE